MRVSVRKITGEHDLFDYVIIGSGFGGSVSAMRLAEKGYKVLVLERGKRFRDQDFAEHNWQLRKYLWMPVLRCFGIQQISMLKDVMVLHGSGVGGGSLVYANVLMEPDDSLFEAHGWRHLNDWKTTLRPHYDMAKRMLGVTSNPCLWPADNTLHQIANELGRTPTFRPTEVGIYFGESGSDPYFDGEGPARDGCTHCGACMVGCRHNAKNTLVKNYLYFAEKWGAEIRAEAQVEDIRPLPANQSDGARYEVVYGSSTAWGMNPFQQQQRIRAKNVIVSAGVLGTLKLLFHCRDVTKSLPKISTHLGERVRTNSEALLGVMANDDHADFSQGIAITSTFKADDVTHIQPVRYPPKSSFMRLLTSPMIEPSDQLLTRLLRIGSAIIRQPVAFARAKFFRAWAERSTIMLVMQTEDNMMRLKLGRGIWTFFRRGLVSTRDNENPIPAVIPIGHDVTKRFAAKNNAMPMTSLSETVLNVSTTAHILGGVPFGQDANEGVIDLSCQVFNYPGLYVIDGSIMPANPGINPSLTITALAEYAMSLVPHK